MILLNGLQRENLVKDVLVYQVKIEIEKFKKELCEKDLMIFIMLIKVRRYYVIILLMLIDIRLLY